MDKKLIKIDRQKLTKQIASLKQIAKKEKWVYLYDKVLDQLSYIPKMIKSNYVLYSLTNEFSVYVDKNSNLKGIFVEYYRSNLATHDKEFKEFMSLFRKKIDDTVTIPSKESTSVNILTDAIQAKILSDVILKDQMGNINIPA